MIWYESYRAYLSHNGESEPDIAEEIEVIHRLIDRFPRVFKESIEATLNRWSRDDFAAIEGFKLALKIFIGPIDILRGMLE